MKHLTLIFALSLWFANNSFARAPSLTGTVYKMDSNRKETLFKTELVTTKEISKKIETASHKTLDGQLVVLEQITFVKDEITDYSIAWKQSREEGRLKVEKERLNFSYTKDGKIKTDSEKLSGHLVVGLSVVPFIHKNWSKLTTGDSIDIRFAVLDRLETVGFELFKDKDKTNEKLVVIQMKPSNFFISALVDPVFFYFDPNSKKITHYIGRIKPKLKAGHSWKPIDAETVYD